MKSKELKKKTNRGLIAQAGMTYVELIVVLSIFATLSAVITYNYHAFQSKIDIKNLVTDIASKIVEAQQSSLSGKLPLERRADLDYNWRPSYGVNFSPLHGISPDTSLRNGTDLTPGTSNNKSFVYFVDRNSNHIFDEDNFEALETITLPTNLVIDSIKSYPNEANQLVLPVGTQLDTQNVAITFTRPSSSALLYYGRNPLSPAYIEITVKAVDSSASATIRVYQSGRIQVN